MDIPKVAIVGRPNVGKSSLLNLLARERVSIVDPRAGITRDRVSHLLEHRERYFELIDTGGIGIVDEDHLEEHVEEQIRFALAQAALVLFVVDALDGVTPLDRRVADMLRKVKAPVVLVANKADQPQHAHGAAELMRLGFGEPLAVSALHSRGRADLLDRILSTLGDRAAAAPPETPAMKLAIVGKRNAGKSTLVNALAGEERVIVSETPGTTRDAVDVRFERDGRVFVAIDTAGVRKKSSMGDIDFYSYTRAVRSIERADVVMHLVDATVPLSEVDVRLARAVADQFRPVVMAINKWDLVGDKATTADFADYMSRTMPVQPYAPLVFMTARTGENVEQAVSVALSLHAQSQTRVPTAQLNQVIQEIFEERSPSTKSGARVRVFYATQVGVAPPTLVLFCSRPELINDSYRRFVENRLRDALPFHEVPMRLLFRSRHRQQAEPAS